MTVISSWSIDFFISMKFLYLPLVILLVKSLFCLISFLTIIVYAVHLFPFFYLRLSCVSEFKVCFLEHTAECCFFNQFDNLCLLSRTFSPFTFNVIIYIIGFTPAILLFRFYLRHTFFYSSVLPLLLALVIFFSVPL